MANFSFTNSGSLPGLFNTSQSTPPIATTPAAKALTTPPNTGYGTNGAPMSVLPSTPVKKTTTNNVDGSSQITEYHAPDTLSNFNPNANYTAGVIPQQPPQGTSVPQLSNAGVSTAPNPTSFSGLIGTAAKTAQGNIPLGQAGNAITQKYEGLINPILKGTIGQEIGDKSTGTTPVGEGNAQLAASAGGALIQGLTNQESQELTGTGQALTAQGQAETGTLGAANLSQPSGTYPFVFNPLSGGFTNAGGGVISPQDAASAVMNGKLSYDQAASSLGYLGGTGSAQLQQAIIAAGGNPLQLQAGGAATQSVIGTQTQQVEGYKSALQQGQNLQSQLTDLIQTFGLNPNDLNAANLGIQKIAQNTSSPQYKILANYVNDIANTYSQILTPPGGSATDTTRGIATSMLDATASGQSLLSVMQSLDQAAQAKIAGVSTTGGSTSSTSSGGSTANPWH